MDGNGSNRRKFFSTSSIEKQKALAETVGRRQLRKQFCVLNARGRLHSLATATKTDIAAPPLDTFWDLGERYAEA